MITMRDVAQRASVSTATVSRVLANDPSVRPQTAGRVIEAARDLGFVPNSLARSLRQQRSATWALIISDIVDPFFTQVARGVEDLAQDAGYSVLLCNTDESPAKEDKYLEIAHQFRVGGVLMTPTTATSRVEGLLRQGVPVVAMNCPLARPVDVDTVLIDFRQAARASVADLLASGRRAIGCITGPAGVFNADERVVGYREAHAAAGLEVDERLIRHAQLTEEGGREASVALLAAGAVDGMLIANGLMVLGALGVLQDQGVEPGQDVEIVAFDDALWTRLLRPAIRVVPQPAYELGRLAGQLLLDRLVDPTCAARTVMLTASAASAAP